MIGLGNTTTNASISFSQRGNTTVQGTYALSETVQFTADATTNGSVNVGFDLNEGNGDRENWNLSFMYDLAGGGLAGSLGYTDPGSKIGLTSTIDRNGLSTSVDHLGVGIATNGPNGFQMDEIDFAQQNINAAQDRTQRDQNNARLIASGDYTADDVAKMKDEDVQKALNDLEAKNPTPAPEPGSFDAFLGSIGDFVGGGMGTVLDVALGAGGVAVGAVGVLAGLAGLPNIPVPNVNNPLAKLMRRPEEDYDSYVDRIKDALGGAWDGTVDGLLSVLRDIENGMGWVGDRIGNAYDAVTGAVIDLFDGGEGETVGDQNRDDQNPEVDWTFVEEYGEVADLGKTSITVKAPLTEGLKGQPRESFGSLDQLKTALLSGESKNLQDKLKAAIDPNNLARTDEGLKKLKEFNTLSDRLSFDPDFQRKISLTSDVDKLIKTIEATKNLDPKDPQLVGLRERLKNLKGEVSLLENKLKPQTSALDQAQKDLNKHLEKVKASILTEYKNKVLDMVKKGDFSGPLAVIQDVKESTPKWTNKFSEIDRIVSPTDRNSLLSAAADSLQTGGLTEKQRLGLERLNQTPQQFLDANPKFAGKEFGKLTPSERVEVMNAMIDNKVVSQSRDGGMAKMVETVFEAIRKEGKDKFQFVSLDGTNGREKNFDFIKGYLFDSNASSKELAGDVTSEFCKVYTNYVQAVANNMTTASFGDFLMAKLKSGDIGADSSKIPKPVMDQNGLTGSQAGIDTKNGLGDKKVSNDFKDIKINENGEVVSGITRPLTNTEIKSVLDSKKPGDVVQVYVDTEEGNPGPNHYHMILKGTDGQWYNMDHTAPKDKGMFAVIDPYNGKIYGLYH